MDLNDKVTQLEDEIKILKNEVQAVLLDLRESYLNNENPFNPSVSPAVSQPIIINQPPAAPVKPPPVIEEAPADSTAVETAPEGHQANEIGLADHPGELETEEPVNEMEKKFQDNELESLDKPASGTEPGYKPEFSTGDEKAPQGLKRAWRPEIETGANFKFKENSDGINGKLDLTTLVNLAQWVEKAVKQLGQERTEVILDISEMMGHINPELKNILVKFINPVPDEHSAKVTTREYLASLIELGSLLGKDSKPDAALLYILCKENDNR